MAFYESPRFPEQISFGATGGPGYQTDVVVVSSGAEARNGAWSQARARYEVSHAARLPADYAPLQAFFRTAKGRLHGFRFKDWSDFSVSGSAGVLIATGVTNEWQLYRRYTSGAQTEDRIIQKPVSGTLALAGGGTYSIDYATGKVTKTAGANPTGWTGEFDVPCRFDVDEMRGQVISRSGGQLVMGWDSIPIIEIRV